MRIRNKTDAINRNSIMTMQDERIYNTTPLLLYYIALKNYKQHNAHYNQDLELTYKHLLGDAKLYVMETDTKSY